MRDPSGQNIPVHPLSLSRRYQAEETAVKNSSPALRTHHNTHELYATNQVRSEVNDEANETKDTSANNQPALTPKIQPIKSATERLKWKFLGW